MKANLVAIKDCVVKAKTWNPVVEAKDENITYIDIAAVDKDLKQVVNTLRQRLVLVSHTTNKAHL